MKRRFSLINHTHSGTVDVAAGALDNQVAVFTDGNTIEGTANLTFDGDTLDVRGAGTATLWLRDTNATTNEQLYSMRSTNGFFSWTANDDAGVFQSGVMLVSRTLGTVTEISFEAPVQIDDAGGAILYFKDNTAPTNNQIYAMRSTNGFFSFTAVDDALAFQDTIFTVFRDGAAIDFTGFPGKIKCEELAILPEGDPDPPVAALTAVVKGGTAQDVFHLRDSTDATDLWWHYNAANFELRSESAGGGKLYFKFGNSTGEVIVGNVLSIEERAAAIASSAGRGQIWVKNTTPAELWFTDDAGTDTKIV